MIRRFKHQNWKGDTPRNVIEYLFSPVGRSLRIVNFIFQKIFRINGGANFMVHYTSTVTCPDKIKMGKGVCQYFAASGSCYVSGINGIEIGDGTIFAPGVKLISANHTAHDFGLHDLQGPIKIGRNCWLGANAIVLPGVELGDDTIVAAGAVISRSFPDGGAVLAGVPGVVVKKLKEKPASYRNGKS